MAVKIVDDPIEYFQGETLTVPANNGVRNAFSVRPGYDEILIEPVAAMRLALVPKIKALLFWDNSASTFTDIGSTNGFFDRTRAVTVTTLGAMTSSDYLYVGVKRPIGGIVIDIGATANAVTSTLSGQYLDTDGVWQTLTIGTDGTASGGATFAVDGDILFTVPTDWRAFELSRVLSNVTGAPNEGRLYWLRFSTSATFTAGVVLANATPLAQVKPDTSTNTAETGGIYLKAAVEYTMDISKEVGSIEVESQTGSATTARVTWIKR